MGSHQVGQTNASQVGQAGAHLMRDSHQVHQTSSHQGCHTGATFGQESETAGTKTFQSAHPERVTKNGAVVIRDKDPSSGVDQLDVHKEINTRFPPLHRLFHLTDPGMGTVVMKSSNCERKYLKLKQVGVGGSCKVSTLPLYERNMI